jgi:hypothetical protein
MWNALKYIWDKKLEIAELARKTQMEKLAHEIAHNIAMSVTDNTMLVAGNAPEYQEIYETQFDRVMIKLNT